MDPKTIQNIQHDLLTAKLRLAASQASFLRVASF